MAVLKPFQAIRPKKGLEEQMAALPYDVYNRAEAKVVVEKNPLSFLAIDRAETQFSDDVDTYADCVYDKAREMLWDRVSKGEYIQETEKCYYIYELVMDGRSQVGIVACASIDDYQNNIIKKHENTRADKEVDRIRHVSTCEAQTGPIFLAYRSNNVINEIVAKKRTEAPLYDFVADDGIAHKVWVINEADSLAKIENAFAEMNEIYIADGHHRCASAVKVGLKLREENPGYDGTEEFNYFLSVLFPDDQLMIMDYNRVVKDLNGNSEDEFISKLEEIYDVAPIGNQAQYPSRKGEISMYMFGEWYRLSVKKEFTSNDPIDGLDVSILQNNVLGPILGIEDPKTDKRIDFVGGIRGLKELERRVSEDCKVAFAMYPTSINELFDVADAGLLMPPKSTWFEPKLRSGIFIHSIRTEA
ncbi:MAG: DUF1015 domain-containing protein [Lachnospiraceae bacterium]|nr:DUF1015 domain-containing protein [Lachnospiraceae bacterium]